MSAAPGVVVLTGAASGIGRRLTGALAALGSRVLATDVDQDRLHACAAEERWSESRVRLLGLDVQSAIEWDAALEHAEREIGPVDVLMNVAGVLRPGYVERIEPEDVGLHLDVNVKGVIFGTRAAARRMLPRGAGHIVNFGSLASLTPVPGLSLYAASKFAVRGFTLSAAVELKPRGVALTLVMPDAVQTPMLDLQADFDEAALTFSGSRPLTVEEIERAVVDHVLPHRPLEVALPLSRALLARVGGLAPGLTSALAPLLVRRGLARQAKTRKSGV